MSAASHAHRSAVRKARGQSVDYTAKNAGRRTVEAVTARKRRVSNRRPPTPTIGRHK